MDGDGGDGDGNGGTEVEEVHAYVTDEGRPDGFLSS